MADPEFDGSLWSVEADDILKTCEICWTDSFSACSVSYVEVSCVGNFSFHLCVPVKVEVF